MIFLSLPKRCWTCSIRTISPDPKRGHLSFEPTADFSEGSLVPRGTLLESEPIEGDICRFRTTQAVDLWPIAVQSATLSGRPLLAPPAPRLEAAASLRLVLRCLDPEQTLTRLGVDRCDSYSRAVAAGGCTLRASAQSYGRNRACGPRGGPSCDISRAGAPSGASVSTPRKALIPPAPRSFPGYRLLTELFACPQKFLFLELSGISAKALRHAGNTLEVFFYLKHQTPELERAVTQDTFALGCTPIVNLFSQRAEPIQLTHELSEYPLVADVRRHATGKYIRSIASL
jgi:type VI secretion system protein ImpG